MGSLNPESTPKQDLDDSGCVQDSSVTEPGYKGQAQLLDLSDDVLLYILKNCTPRDLKALGHTCPRLGALVCDRTLWTQVDARSSPVGQERLRWYLTHCFSPATVEIKLTGYANKNSKCLGIQDLHWPAEPASGFARVTRIDSGPGVDVEHFLLRMWYPHLPRFAVSPRWPDKAESESKNPKKAEASKIPQNDAGPSNASKDVPNVSGSSEKASKSPESTPPKIQVPIKLPEDFEDFRDDCRGPKFTLTANLMRDLRSKCEHLTSLVLEYCNIDYKATSICQFPPKLKKLSLRGTLCFNLPLNTSYLGKIQERLPGLEYLDVSECDWFEPASLMPLSKLVSLKELYMRDCKRLTECVAYASLATRYGFRKIRVMDVRGSPLADSEISALGWLPLLEELYCAPPEDFMSSSEHTHSWKDTRTKYSELDSWEIDEPYYYKSKSPEPSERMDVEEKPKRREEAKASSSGPPERMGDVLLGNPWWAHERRIIIIQPNANSQFEQQFPRLDDVADPPEGGNPPAGDASARAVPAVQVQPPLNQNPGPIDLIVARINQAVAAPIHQNPRNQAPLDNQNPGDQNPAPIDEDPPPEAGPSKRLHDDVQVLNLAKRPRLDAASDDEDDDQPQGNQVPNVSVEECPRLRDQAAEDDRNGQDSQSDDDMFDGEEANRVPINMPVERRVLMRSPACRNIVNADQNPNNIPAARYVEFQRNADQLMHINVDLQRQSTIHIGGHVAYGYHLVSDSAIVRFGNADNDNVIHIGRNGVRAGEPGRRPDRSNLRILSVTGYRNITDRSLQHLATAAPHIMSINFTETKVTQKGVDIFKAIRPNCEIIFSEFGKSK